MRKFVIDTDTASDDAVALVMALQAPDVAVEAITAVAGNVPLERALQAALYTVEICGKTTPVYAGLESPMICPLTTAEEVHGTDGLGDIGLDLTGRTPADGHAVDVLIRTICDSPGEITLVTLGPLSNVATALVGWDASMAFGFIPPEIEAEIRAIDTPLARFVCDIQSHVSEFVARLSGKAGFDLPDPLAMAVALDPDIAEVEDYYVEVITGEGPARGQTVLDVWRRHGREPNASVVRRINPADFQEALKAAVRRPVG